MTAALCIVRLALAIIFALAGLAKLVNRTGTRRALREFGVPEHLLGTGAVAIPVVEPVVAGVVLSGGGESGAPLPPQYNDVHPVLLQRHREVALAYGVTAVPSAATASPTPCSQCARISASFRSIMPTSST